MSKRKKVIVVKLRPGEKAIVICKHKKKRHRPL